MQSRNSDYRPGNETPTQRLASVLLGDNVLTFIQKRRSAGIPWRLIERELREATDGQVDVTYETLRQWHESTRESA